MKFEQESKHEMNSVNSPINSSESNIPFKISSVKNSFKQNFWERLRPHQKLRLENSS